MWEGDPKVSQPLANQTSPRGKQQGEALAAGQGRKEAKTIKENFSLAL